MRRWRCATSHICGRLSSCSGSCWSATPHQMNMKPTQEVTFLIGKTKILRLLPFQDLGGQYVSIFGLISKVRLQQISFMLHRRKHILFVTLLPTHLFGWVQHSLISSSQPITIKPLTNNTQSNQTNKKKRELFRYFFVFLIIFSSNILKVNFNELRI